MAIDPYIKHYHLPEWAVENKPRFDKLRNFCKSHSKLQDYEPFFNRWSDEEMCNTAICLCHMVDKAMTTFLAKRDREFVEEGGIRERMTAARLDHRGTQKQIIAQQAAEIAQLKAQIASLQRELAQLRGHAGSSGVPGVPGEAG